ncbi:MAG: hypothetical protein HWQ41_12010 [Nostoc sp. NOS(2021)]|uniref:hypothetical protein n=1 Tax=Nostoc sp. NOS(2021) TaxID=2815407 RepID=UPI0025FE7C80|nr:hypothetical protein [Nostoc sp. NOS(2021)]MBN3895953.1 hypothetical protein [Nostoc sp. NOS(2021)]
MRERVSQPKKATTASSSIPSLKHPIHGFGLDSSQASPQAVPLVQPLNKPLGHDISRIPLRRPQAKLTVNQPGDVYEQEADRVAGQVMQTMNESANTQSIQRQELPEEEEELQTKSLANSTIQRLIYKTDNTNVNIEGLSFARVLDYLKRPDPDLDPGGVIFEAGDKDKLREKADQLYLIEFNKLHRFLGTPAVNNEKTKRNFPGSVDLPQLLTDMQTRYEAGNLPGFRDWLAGVNVNLNAENVLDKINELRAAQNIVGAVNIDETAIAGTNQTADLTDGNSQTEVKTIRKPIQGYSDFTGQVTAALGKFANVDPEDGKTYNVIIYGSIDQTLITGKTTKKNGIVNNTQIDPTNLDKVTTVTRQNDKERLRQTRENQLDKLLDNLNGQRWAGANLTHHIYIFLENGTQQHLIRDDKTTNKWARA